MPLPDSLGTGDLFVGEFMVEFRDHLKEEIGDAMKNIRCMCFVVVWEGGRGEGWGRREVEGYKGGIV